MDIVNSELFRYIDQIGVLTVDPEKTMKNMEMLFGIKPTKFGHSLRGNACGYYRGMPRDAEIEMIFYQFENVHIEIIYPKDGKSIHNEYLEKRGTGLYHIRFNVDNFEETIAWFKERGYEPVMGGDSANVPGAKWCYYDFFDELGYYVEIINLREVGKDL